MYGAKRTRRLALCAALLLVWVAAAPRTAEADTLVAIMSEASAPEFAAAAATLAADGTPHRLVFRATPQIARMSDAELIALLEAADGLVVAGVFGEDAVRLRRLLPKTRAATVVPLHGDAQFLRQARFEGRAAFAGRSPDEAAARLRELAAGPVGDLGAAASPEALLAHARRYRDARGTGNLITLLRFISASPEIRAALPPPVVGAAVRFLDATTRPLPAPASSAPAVAILDYDSGDQAGDRDLHRALCAALESQGLGCLSVLARWGRPTIDALQSLNDAKQRGALQLRGIVVLQDFVLGGGAGSKEATAKLVALDVPVLKGVRMNDRSRGAWRVSEDGVPDTSVHYRLAMPELQGIAQPFVVAAAGPTRIEPASGLELAPVEPEPDEVDALAARLGRLAALARRDNAEKRIAVVYYNHPPGRHNIGADNLDAPASLLSILRILRDAGYDTGELPEDSEALLSILQERGVNLPEDGAALARMAGRVPGMSVADYASFFGGLPSRVQAAMRDGPLAALREVVTDAVADGEAELAKARVHRVLGDVEHLVEGAVHPKRQAALDALEGLEADYDAWLGGDAPAAERVAERTRAIARLGIEGLAGWGELPGRVMTHEGRFVFPGVTFGKVFVGPQPPRGWELDEELLHANLSFPPPHQYLAFYEYLRNQHRADAVVHVGRHSTYEFLPGRRAGLGSDDFPRIVLGDLPSVYLYIVDGVGEGIQAKRRGQAIIIDHLTPSLQTTPLYDELLSLRQLVESYEAASGVEGHARARALAEIRATIDRLHLQQEIEAIMVGELEARGIGFDEVDGALLVHEVGHYLTEMQERFMPHGLHVFGEAWAPEAVDRMIASMSGDEAPRPEWKQALVESPQREAEAMLAALDGRFTQPGPGNDPVRTPEVLPTGRSFHALDASVLPTRLGYELGVELAEEARRAASGTAEGAEAVVLWASDTVRDEGAMVGFGLQMLGVVPRWNSRGIVRGMEREPLAEGRVRRDTSFVASGLFRDLYAPLCDFLDQAVLTALDGASATIVAEHPALGAALEATLAPLGDARAPGGEALSVNQVAAHWVGAASALLEAGLPPAEAGPQAAARVFGDAPGSYGAGINRLAERSGAWHSREELVDTFVRRIGHAYGGGRAGAPAHAAFERILARTEHTYLGRASNLYGVLDNNDVFDYLGGLGMAVEEKRGAPPAAHVVQHADPNATGIEPLTRALLRELRGRHLNPTYLKGLMAHGYAGARTMGTGFVENLWGWQVTSPHIVKSWAWDEVKAVYLDDRHGIGLDRFLADGENVHVRTNIQAVMLVAAHKGFWEVDEETLRAFSEAFAAAVVEHGLPGSGHTRPDHPMMADVLSRIPEALAQQLRAELDAAAGQSAQALVSELNAADAPAPQPSAPPEDGRGTFPRVVWPGIFSAAAVLVALGFLAERRRRSRS